MRSSTIGSWIGTLLTLIVFGGFGLVFASLGVYAGISSYPKQGSTAIVGGAVFVIFGLGLAALVAYGCVSNLRDLRRQAADPDHPWLWSRKWNSADTTDHPLGGAVGTWIIALFWNGSTATAALGMFNSGNAQPAGCLIVLTFAAVGIYLLIAGVRLTQRAIRYGTSTLHLTTIPAPIGGRLIGTIRTRHPIDALGPPRVRLTCQRVVRDGKYSTTSTVWEDVKDEESLTAEGAIPVDFQIPTTVPPTGPSGSGRDAIHWDLEATVAARGVSYRSRFEVPVFDVQGIGTGTANTFTPPPPPESNLSGDDEAAEPATHPGIVLTRLADRGCSVHFAAGRNWGSTIIFTLIGAGLSVGLWYSVHLHAFWLLQFWLWVFAAAFDYAALNGWLSSTTVVARREGLHIDRGWPLIRSRKDLSAASVADVMDSTSSQAGNTTYYRLQAKVDGASDVTIASGIRDRRAARWIASELLLGMGKAIRSRNQ